MFLLDKLMLHLWWFLYRPSLSSLTDWSRSLGIFLIMKMSANFRCHLWNRKPPFQPFQNYSWIDLLSHRGASVRCCILTYFDVGFSTGTLVIIIILFFVETKLMTNVVCAVVPVMISIPPQSDTADWLVVIWGSACATFRRLYLVSIILVLLIIIVRFHRWHQKVWNENYGRARHWGMLATSPQPVHTPWVTRLDSNQMAFISPINPEPHTVKYHNLITK